MGGGEKVKGPLLIVLLSLIVLLLIPSVYATSNNLGSGDDILFIDDSFDVNGPLDSLWSVVTGTVDVSSNAMLMGNTGNDSVKTQQSFSITVNFNVTLDMIGTGSSRYYAGFCKENITSTQQFSEDVLPRGTCIMMEWTNAEEFWHNITDGARFNKPVFGSPVSTGTYTLRLTETQFGLIGSGGFNMRNHGKDMGDTAFFVVSSAATSGTNTVDNLFLNSSGNFAPPAFTNLTNSTWNVTSENVQGSTTEWNTGGTVNVTSNLLSFTVSTNVNTNMTCSLQNINYSEMFTANPNFKAATTETTSHTNTLFDNITFASNIVYCDFARTDGFNDTGHIQALSGPLLVNFLDVTGPFFTNNDTSNHTPRELDIVTFNITVNDNLTNVSYAIFSIQNGSIFTNETPIEILPPLSNVGTVEISAQISVGVDTFNWTWFANDSFNNFGQSDVFSIIVTLDTTPPFFGNESNSSDDNPLELSTITVNISVTDAESNLSYVILQYHNGTELINNSQIFLIGNTAIVSDTLIVPNATQVNWSWYASDIVGNINQSDVFTIILDHTPPILISANPTSGNFSQSITKDFTFIGQYGDSNGISVVNYTFRNSTDIISTIGSDITDSSEIILLNYTFDADLEGLDEWCLTGTGCFTSIHEWSPNFGGAYHIASTNLDQGSAIGNQSQNLSIRHRLRWNIYIVNFSGTGNIASGEFGLCNASLAPGLDFNDGPQLGTTCSNGGNSGFTDFWNNVGNDVPAITGHNYSLVLTRVNATGYTFNVTDLTNNDTTFRERDGTIAGNNWFAPGFRIAGGVTSVDVYIDNIIISKLRPDDQLGTNITLTTVINLTQLADGQYEGHFNASDDRGNDVGNIFTYSVINPFLNISLVDPAANTNVTQFALFNFTVNVTCGGNCEDILVSLDSTNVSGVLSNITGDTPFYVIGVNPITINLGNNGTTLVNFTLNATGTLDAFYEMFAIANLSSLQSISAETNIINITIANIAPVASNVSIIPQTLFTDSIATCIYDYTDFNQQVDNGTIFRWFNNDVEISGQTFVILNGTPYFNKSQTVICEVEPSDGRDFGDRVNSSGVVINNSAPTFDEALTNQIGNIGFNFVYNINSTDVDGDTITYVINDSIISINQSGTITDLPVLGEEGKYEIRVNISDNENAATIGFFNYTILTIVPPTIDLLEIIPAFPASSDNLVANFTITKGDTFRILNASITWFNSTDNITYTNIATFDFVFIDANGTNSTTVGQGTFTDTLANFSFYKASMNVTDGFVTVFANSTEVSVFPLRDLTIFSPPNDTFSNVQLNINFTIFDEDGGISCDLNVNDSTIVTTPVVSGDATTLAYTPITDRELFWNISCTSTGNPDTSVFNEDRFFTFDTTPPAVSNFGDDSTFEFPETGDTIILNLTVTDNFQIDRCQLFVNDSGQFTDRGNFSVNTYFRADVDLAFTVTNESTAANQNVTWFSRCFDSATNNVTGAVQTFTVVDVTFPIIRTVEGSSINENNQSVISPLLHNLTLLIKYSDFNLFQIEANVTCAQAGNIFTFQELNVSGNVTFINTSVDLTGLDAQACNFTSSASDSHTENFIPDYDIDEIDSGLRFETEHDQTIEIVSVEADSNVIDKRTEKKDDRYEFGFEFTDKTLVRTFIVRSDNKIYERDSQFPGHFVIWNEETNGGNWVDFAELDMLNQNYAITKISDFEYRVDVTPEILDSDIDYKPQFEDKYIRGVGPPFLIGPDGREMKIPGFERQKAVEFARVQQFKNLQGEANNYDELVEKYGITDYTFQSVGGTNIFNLTIGFFLGGAVNTSSLNIYDNTSFFNYTVAVNTTNGPINISRLYIADGTDTGFADNLTVGNYTFDFTHPDFFPQSFNVEITNGTGFVDQVYNSSQGIVRIVVRNVATQAIQTGLNITIINLNSSQVTSIVGTTKEINSFPLNISTYDLFINKSQFDELVTNFSISAQEDKLINISLNFLATFFLFDERTGGVFNISGADRVTFLLFCPDGTFTTEINVTTPVIPIDCDYIKFKFILDYGAISYFRTLILDPDDGLKVDIFLIDLLTTDRLFNTFILDDLFGDFDNPRIFIKKVINDQTVQITADFVDVEDKISASLIESNEYIIEVHSDNNPVRVLGIYAADLPGEKTLRLFDINLAGESQAFGDNVHIIMRLTNRTSSGNGTATDFYVEASYQDDINETNSVTFNVYRDTYNGTVIFTDTVSGVALQVGPIQQVIFEFNATPFINNTALVGEFVISHQVVGGFNFVKLLSNPTKILLDIFTYLDQDFLNWFFTLIFAAFAMYATIHTGNYVAIALVGLAAFVTIVGWYGVSFSILALAGLIAFVSLLREGEKGMT